MTTLEKVMPHVIGLGNIALLIGLLYIWTPTLAIYIPAFLFFRDVLHSPALWTLDVLALERMCRGGSTGALMCKPCTQPVPCTRPAV